MAEGIPATELRVGDMFVNPQHVTFYFRGPRVVNAIRPIITAGGSYQVVDYTAVWSGANGRLDLRSDVAVLRLEAVHLAATGRKLADLPTGEQVTFYRVGDTLWV